MSTVFTLFMVLIIIASVLLVIIVMAQNPKGGGLSSTFGGASSTQFGVQRTNDFMEKATWYLGGFIAVLCLLSVVLTAKPSQDNVKKPATTEKSSSAPENSKPATTPTPKANTTGTTLPATTK